MLLMLKRIMAMLALVAFGTAAQAQEEYRIKPGDTLTVEVLEDTSLNRSVVVLPDGRFSFPFAGAVTGSGRTVGQIEAAIKSGIGSNFTVEPNVFVSVQPGKRTAPAGGSTGRTRTIDVYFLGEVNAPGGKEIDRGTRFLQAVALAGGMTRFAATKRIQLRRTDPKTGQEKVYTFNYKAMARGAVSRSNPTLIDGDVILVPERRLFE